MKCPRPNCRGDIIGNVCSLCAREFDNGEEVRKFEEALVSRDHKDKFPGVHNMPKVEGPEANINAIYLTGKAFIFRGEDDNPLFENMIKTIEERE